VHVAGAAAATAAAAAAAAVAGEEAAESREPGEVDGGGGVWARAGRATGEQGCVYVLIELSLVINQNTISNQAEFYLAQQEYMVRKVSQPHAR
jgi:hypothetical protein